MHASLCGYKLIFAEAAMVQGKGILPQTSPLRRRCWTMDEENGKPLHCSTDVLMPVTKMKYPFLLGRC